MAVILAPVSGPGGEWADFPKETVEKLVFVTLVLTGAIQFGIGLLGLARFSKLIPFTAMIGFLNGLAIIILRSQLDAFKECPGNQDYEVCAREETLEWMPLDAGRTWMVILEVAMSVAIVVFLPRFKTLTRYVPPVLVALVTVTAFEHGINRPFIDLPVRTVKETAPVDGTFIAPDIPSIPSSEWTTVTITAVTMALVGLIESIMTSEAVAEIMQQPLGRFASTQDSLSQGLGNFLCGLLGSMGGDSMIGQSTVNVMNGACGRLSTSSSSVFLAIIILAISSAIGLLPVACLTGVLFIVVVKTFHWPTFTLLLTLSLADALAIVLVTVLAVVTNLAVAVISGVVWRALVHAYASGNLIHIRTEDVEVSSADAGNSKGSTDSGVGPVGSTPAPTTDNSVADADSIAATPGSAAPSAVVDVGATEHDELGDPALEPIRKIYHVEGPLFFGSAMTFRTSFNPADDPRHIAIDFSESLVADFSAVTAIRAVWKRYQQVHKTVTVRGLDAHSRLQIHRNRKLRHHALHDAGPPERSEPASPRSERTLVNLDMLQPGGDEVYPTSDEVLPEDIISELRQAGVDVETSIESAAAGDGAAGSDGLRQRSVTTASAITHTQQITSV